MPIPSNYDNQCILWTLNSNPCIADIEFHLSQIMDIGISLHQNNNVFTGQIEYSKWQSFNNAPAEIFYKS